MLLYLYAWRLSAAPFTGNLIVAFNTGLTFIFGAAAAGEVLSIPAIALAGMALFATLAREIYKSIQDMKADKGHRETLPMNIGVGKSSLVAAFALATAVMLSPIPYWAGTLSAKYILLIALVDAGFLYTAFNGMYSRNHAKEAYYCKLFQAAALIAFVAGVF
jgi:geranylgeranylglycerol-phosphate geranylgeranyltransferase